MTPQQHRAARLAALGYSATQIAKELHAGGDTVAAWFRNVGFLEKIRELQEHHDDLVESHLLKLELKAVKRLDELMDSEDDKVALTAAVESLNRMGKRGSPITKARIEQLSANVSNPDVLIAMALRDPGVRAFLERNPDLKQKLLPKGLQDAPTIPVESHNVPA